MDKVIGLIAANYETPALGTLTAERTVASLPFGGRYRLIDFPLSNMVNAGIRTVGVVTSQKYRSLLDHIGAGKDWSLDRNVGGLCVLPGSTYGITSIGSRFVLRDLEQNMVYLMRSPAPYVIVAAANSVNNIDYTDVISAHIKSGADITMVCRKASKAAPLATALKVEGERISGVSHGVKSGDIEFLDCFVASRDLLLKLVEWYRAINYLDLFEVIANDYDKMMVLPYEFKGYSALIADIGSYYSHSMDLLRTSVYDELFCGERPVITKVRDAVPTKYMNGAKVANSLIPAGCIIRGTVKNSILFRGARIEEGAVVENSILFKDSIIKAGAVVANAILDRHNTIEEGAVIKGSSRTPFIKDKGII